MKVFKQLAQWYKSRSKELDSLTPALTPALTHHEVIENFKYFLLRHPEVESVIDAHAKLGILSELARVLTQSREFELRKNQGFRIFSIGNCQAAVIASLLNTHIPNSRQIGFETTPNILAKMSTGELSLDSYIQHADLIVLSQHLPDPIKEAFSRYPNSTSKCFAVPNFSFNGFHPDITYVSRPKVQGHFKSALSDYHSKLVLWAFRNQLSTDEAEALFRADIMQRIGYFDYFDAACESFVAQNLKINLPVRQLLEQWVRSGVFMHTINHPKKHVMHDIANHILKSRGFSQLPSAESFGTDTLATHPCWPVYPPIAHHLNLPEGSYLFKRGSGNTHSVAPHTLSLSLKEYIDQTYAMYAEIGHDDLVCPTIETPEFTQLTADWKAGKIDLSRPPRSSTAALPANLRSSPYKGLPDQQFWRRSVQEPAMSDLDPVQQAAFQILPTHKVATAGSCFAQHIARTLKSNGFNYYVTEDGAGLETAAATHKNYGVFSARYGNLYTTRQLMQLFERAYGRFDPVDSVWMRDDGRFADPFRPQIEPEGFATEKELLDDREIHFAQVRKMFETLDVFVFTLGLTEAWRSRIDGAVFPIAPGVVAGQMDEQCYEFVNFEATQVTDDLLRFVDGLRAVNPDCKLILTVSPVPLVATYENRHVLVSTTYSKAALRVAAESVVKRAENSVYFPSYEIITGNFNRGAYFDDDLRSVKPEGVSHVMGLFMKHYAQQQASGNVNPSISKPQAQRTLREQLMQQNRKNSEIVCDEEALDR